jgi:hypothetical protein
MGHFTERGVHDIDSFGLAVKSVNHVIECQWPTQKRVVAAGQSQHKELPGEEASCDFRRCKPKAVRLACELHILDRFNSRLQCAIGIELGVQRVTIGGGQSKMQLSEDARKLNSPSAPGAAGTDGLNINR